MDWWRSISKSKFVAFKPKLLSLMLAFRITKFKIS